MASQLSLYNEALRLIGERRLASISENREPRRVLDDVWNDGAIDYCLEQGQWNFAMRAIMITKSTTTIPTFGYTNAFDKPSDFVNTAGVCSDEFFNVPVTEMVEEVGFWFSNLDTLYIRYVSNANNYGSDLTLWPASFTKYVAAYLASEIVWTLTQDPNKQKIILSLMARRLLDARSQDAMGDPTAFTPEGGWSASRRGRNRRDRGKRGQLIG